MEIGPGEAVTLSQGWEDKRCGRGCFYDNNEVSGIKERKDLMVNGEMVNTLKARVDGVKTNMSTCKELASPGSQALLQPGEKFWLKTQLKCSH